MSRLGPGLSKLPREARRSFFSNSTRSFSPGSGNSSSFHKVILDRGESAISMF